MLDLNSIEYIKTKEGLEALYGDTSPASPNRINQIRQGGSKLLDEDGRVRQPGSSAMGNKV